MKTRSSSRIAASSSAARSSSATAACSSSADRSKPTKPSDNSSSITDGTHGENDYAPSSTASPTRSDADGLPDEADMAMVDSESESFSLYPEVLLTEEELPTQVSVKDNLETGGETLLKMEDVMPQKAPSVNVLFTTPARKVPVKFNAAHIFLEATKDINNNKGKGKKSSDTKHSTMDDTTGDPKVESDQKTFSPFRTKPYLH